MKPYKTFIYLVVLTATLFNLTNSLSLFNKLDNIKVVVFLSAHVIVLAGLIALLYKEREDIKGIIAYTISAFENAGVPVFARYVIGIVLVGNLLSIAFAKPIYPFYDVGMFRGNAKFENESKVVAKPKYFYWKNNTPEILDIRKEGLFFLAEHWGWGYSQEFTFAATFHNKGQKENFDFILSRIKKTGVDTLWVGVHYVDYATRKVWFDPDICAAIGVNKNEKIHYGPIYIPEYQLQNCHE